MSDTKWADKVDRIKELAAEGLSGGQIAREFGVTRNAIIGMMSRRGIKLMHAQGGEPGVPKPKRERLKYKGAADPRELKIRQRASSTLAVAAVMAKARADGELEPLETIELEAVEAVDLIDDGSPRVKFFDLERWTCRWPLGKEVTDPDFGFCRNRAVQGLPYCAGHARIAYRPIEGRRTYTRRKYAVV